MTEQPPRVVMLTVDAESDQAFVDLYEQLGRIAAGLILDGREARLSTFVDTEAAS